MTTKVSENLNEPLVVRTPERVQGHTPGPWYVADDDGYRVRIVATQMRTVAHTVWRDDRAANARLIAAAPELLAACQAAMHALEGQDTPAWLPRWSAPLLRQLRAAIAAATGGAQ